MNRTNATLQEDTENTPPPMLANVLASLRQALENPNNSRRLNEQLLQERQSDSVPASKTCQTDECMVEEPVTPHHRATSESDAAKNNKLISDQDISTDEVNADTNNVDSHRISSETSIAGSSRAALNSTLPETYPTARSDQQTLSAYLHKLHVQLKGEPTLDCTCDICNYLQSEILECDNVYNSLMDAVRRSGRVGNLSASSSSNVTPEVPTATEERHAEVTSRANSSDENQHNNIVDKASNKNATT